MNPRGRGSEVEGTQLEPAGPWLDALVDVVGEENVVDPAATVIEDYLDPYGFEEPRRPAGVVKPGSAEEVVRVVEVAREHGLKLWTVSRGRNFSYGGAEARLEGCVVCDLSRMDKILSIDEDCGSALVEPGVSFQALDAHLREQGSALAVSVPDLSWGSLVGNTMDRGMSYTSHCEHQATNCGMEVVLGDGRVIRTGLGASPEAKAWNLYRGAYGPSLDGLFLQSNLGIVTKMGVWLRRRPEWSVAVTVAVPRDDQLADLVEVLRPLLLTGTIEGNVVIGNAVATGSLTQSRKRFYAGSEPIPGDAIDAMAAQLGLGRWNAELGIYGATGMVKARLAEVREAVAAIPGANMEETEYAGDVDPGEVDPRHRTQIGIPSNDNVEMAAWYGGRPAHADLGLVCPATAEDARAVQDLMRGTVEAAGFDFASGFMQFRRHLIAISLLCFDGDDPDQRERVSELITDLIVAGSAAGYPPYRTHVAHMDVAAEQFSFNDHVGMRVVEGIKEVFDPDGILAPGKQGIWPQGSGRERVGAPA